MQFQVCVMGVHDIASVMQDKLPIIGDGRRTTQQGFHSFRSHIGLEEVTLEFDDAQNGTKLPALQEGGVVANQPFNEGGPDEEDSDEKHEVADALPVGISTAEYCKLCAEKAAMDSGKLTEKIIELKLETERQRIQFETTKRRLDNTSKELKTAQAMIETLKAQNKAKADKIASLSREATIGLWNKEKKKLLQFADVREASLEHELKSLKDNSTDFKFRALDKIQFLNEQVYKLKLRLNLQKSGGQVGKVLELAEKRLKITKEKHHQELEKQQSEFLEFRKNMVGMLAGFHKDFRFLTDQVDTETYEANAEFFDLADKFEGMLGSLHQASLEDNLTEVLEETPAKFALAEGAKMVARPNKPRRSSASPVSNIDVSLINREGSMTEEEMLEKLQNIESVLEKSSKELQDFNEKIPEVNDVHDSGVSLNDYESTIRNGSIGHTGSLAPSSVTPDHHNKTVRFDDDHEDSWRKRKMVEDRRHKDAIATSDKSIQTDFLNQSSVPNDAAHSSNGDRSRNGKRSKKSKSVGSRSRSTTPAKKKKTPKRIDAGLRAKKEQELQHQWLAKKVNQLKKKDPSQSKTKSRQNNLTFTHLREMYGDRRSGSLVDRTAGVVDIEKACKQFPSLTRPEIMEGFTNFVQYDGNNNYKLDIAELLRAVSRTTGQVHQTEEVREALFEVGLMDSDELDFFDFLCIQETLKMGTFDKSKSKMLRSQTLEGSRKTPISRLCSVM